MYSNCFLSPFLSPLLSVPPPLVLLQAPTAMYTACGVYKYSTTASARIGSGGECVGVFVGEHALTGVKVAIKLLKPGTLSAPPNELTMLTALPPHAHIVPVPVATAIGTRSRALVFPLYLADLHR